MTKKCNLVGLEFNHRLWALDVVITNTQTDGINGSDFFSVLIYGISASVLPFLPGDIIKICLCVFFVKKLRPSVAVYFGE